MARGRIGAITFDLWDCLFFDESDEPKRRAAGLPPKPAMRRQLVHEYLNLHAPIARETIDLAYDVQDAAFRKVWHDQYVTWTVRERMQVLLAGLNRELPEPELAELTNLHERMEIEYRPDPVPGAREALHELKGRYPLIILSDAIFTPGRNLRELLKGAGMFECFDDFLFSDEIGWSKPAPQVFRAAAKVAGCELSEIVHVGDRPHNDIGGPHAVGARGILMTAAKQRPLEGHVPDAVCNDYKDLAAVVAQLDKE
jgi:putative hydrolase of the HAD superfamily